MTTIFRPFTSINFKHTHTTIDVALSVFLFLHRYLCPIINLSSENERFETLGTQKNSGENYRDSQNIIKSLGAYYIRAKSFLPSCFFKFFSWIRNIDLARCSAVLAKPSWRLYGLRPLMRQGEGSEEIKRCAPGQPA